MHCLVKQVQAYAQAQVCACSHTHSTSSIAQAPETRCPRSYIQSCLKGSFTPATASDFNICPCIAFLSPPLCLCVSVVRACTRTHTHTHMPMQAHSHMPMHAHTHACTHPWRLPAQVFPESADIKPGCSATFRVAFRPPRDCAHFCQTLTLCAHIKAMRNFRLLSDSQVCAPQSWGLLLDEQQGAPVSHACALGKGGAALGQAARCNVHAYAPCHAHMLSLGRQLDKRPGACLASACPRSQRLSRCPGCSHMHTCSGILTCVHDATWRACSCAGPVLCAEPGLLSCHLLYAFTLVHTWMPCLHRYSCPHLDSMLAQILLSTPGRHACTDTLVHTWTACLHRYSCPHLDGMLAQILLPTPGCHACTDTLVHTWTACLHRYSCPHLDGMLAQILLSTPGRHA